MSRINEKAIYINWELQLAKAIQVATDAHKDQLDKAGQPYILHPLRVMMKFQGSIPMMIIAVLHDVLEDSDLYDEEYILQNFSQHALNVLKKLNRKCKTYDQYIKDLSDDRDARSIKIADLQDNMDLNRLPEVTEKDLDRFKKYFRYFRFLKDKEEEYRRDHLI